MCSDGSDSQSEHHCWNFRLQNTRCHDSRLFLRVQVKLSSRISSDAADLRWNSPTYSLDSVRKYEIGREFEHWFCRRLALLVKVGWMWRPLFSFHESEIRGMRHEKTEKRSFRACSIKGLPSRYYRALKRWLPLPICRRSSELVRRLAASHGRPNCDHLSALYH